MAGEISKGVRMIILVTGATGLLGTNLVLRLRKEGHDVYTMSRREGFDLADTIYTDHFVDQVQPEVVYHLAANAAESRGQISPIDMTQRNIGIFVSVLRAAINAKVKKFIYTSSAAVYGEATIPYKEDGETVPEDVYGVNKLACEQILKIMAKVYNMEYIIFRPHNLYGPHQNMNDPYRNVVALFMRRLIEGEPYKLYGEGKMRRAFSYIDDVVDVMVDSLDKFPNQTINVGSDKDISIRELSDTLQRVTGIKASIEMADARKQEISMFLADHTRQNSLTTYKETPIEEGLLKTWEWAKKKGIEELEEQENEIQL